MICMCEVGEVTRPLSSPQMQKVADWSKLSWREAATEHLELESMYEVGAPYMTIYDQGTMQCSGHRILRDLYFAQEQARTAQTFLCTGPGGVTVDIINVHAPSGTPKLTDKQRKTLLRKLLQSNSWSNPDTTIGGGRFLIGGDMNTGSFQMSQLLQQLHELMPPGTQPQIHEPTFPQHGDLCISGGFPAETLTATADNHDPQHKPYGICWSTLQESATEQPSEKAPRRALSKEPAMRAGDTWGRQGAPSSSGSATEQPLQAPPRAGPPLGHLPQGSATELCVYLDAALAGATKLGWPKWCTPGTGGGYPKRIVHDFEWEKMKYGARIDFCRGTPSDDVRSVCWQQLYMHLPRYQAYMGSHQGPKNPESIGNAMEQAIGVAYAAATKGCHLPSVTSLHWDTEEQEAAWLRAWDVYLAMGFTPQHSARASSGSATEQPLQAPAPYPEPAMPGMQPGASSAGSATEQPWQASPAATPAPTPEPGRPEREAEQNLEDMHAPAAAAATEPSQELPADKQMIYAVVNEFLGNPTYNHPEVEALLLAALDDECSLSPQMYERLEDVFSPIFFHFPRGLKDRSVRQLNDTSQYIRQWYELADLRLPVLRRTAAAADRELTRNEVGEIFRGYMDGLKLTQRPDQEGKKWRYWKSSTETQMRRMAGHTFVAKAIWTIGLPAIPSFATEQPGQRLSSQDLKAVPDAIQSVLNWLDRLATALQESRSTPEYQEAKRKGGVAKGVSGLSATEQKARTAIRKAKYDLSRAKGLANENYTGTRRTFQPGEQRLLDAYRQGTLQRTLQGLKRQYQGDTMHRSPLPP